MFFLEPEGIPCPYGDKPSAIFPKCMEYHIIYTVGLSGAPDHNIEPCACLRREKIRTQGVEVRPAHDAAGRGVLVMLVMAAIGLWGTWGTEEEATVEIEDEELAGWCGEGFGGRRGELDIGG